MVSELEKKALWSIKRDIEAGYRNSGGDWTKAELLETARKRHNLTPEQYEHLRKQVDRSIPDDEECVSSPS